jgi:hypothetical protein
MIFRREMIAFVLLALEFGRIIVLMDPRTSADFSGVNCRHDSFRIFLRSLSTTNAVNPPVELTPTTVNVMLETQAGHIKFLLSLHELAFGQTCDLHHRPDFNRAPASRRNPRRNVDCLIEIFGINQEEAA